MPGKVPLRRDEVVDQRASRMGVSRGVLLPVDPPRAKADWHPTAKRLYASFGESGQVEWWQQSDWLLAFSLMEDLSWWKRTEELAVRSRKVREGWDSVAAGLTPDEREAEGWSRERPKVSQFASPQKMQVIYQMLGSLLITEADRRKAHIELEREVEVVESPVAVQMADYRRKVKAG
ncbi:hypothetical protein [Schaalia sp. ZJ1691]|uniref:phage terminase small subunit n=1 Tax=Schaalia sp. ZJ1691 TaxID=2709404 RepID=UPI0013EE3726|nr:hypothetical protein [Schaalia sp. ZJ1691]